MMIAIKQLGTEIILHLVVCVWEGVFFSLLYRYSICLIYFSSSFSTTVVEAFGKCILSDIITMMHVIHFSVNHWSNAVSTPYF